MNANKILSFSVSVFALVTVAFLATPQITKAAVSDSFNTLDTTTWYANNSSIASAPVIENGRLKEVGAAGDQATSSSEIVSKCKLQGDYDIQVDYDASQLPTSDSSAAMGIAVLGNNTETYSMYILRNSDGTYSLGAYTSQGWNTWTNGTAIQNNVTGTFRLKRVGTTMHGYQLQGGNWVEIATINGASTGDEGVFLNTYNNITVGTASSHHPSTPVGFFDNFISSNNFVCPAVTPACTSANWTSTFSPTTCPSSGTQTKTWTKIGTCSGGVTHTSSENVSCNYNVSTGFAIQTLTATNILTNSAPLPLLDERAS